MIPFSYLLGNSYTYIYIHLKWFLSKTIDIKIVLNRKFHTSDRTNKVHTI